jgi:hypothetical protein
MPRNFLTYKTEQLAKVNAQRRALSQPTILSVPILIKGQVLFTPASELHDEPASCYNCVHYNAGRSCALIGTTVKIKKFIYPPEATADAKRIEYWPCCSAHLYGSPHEGTERFMGDPSDPDNLGLGWINAPSVGLELGGANCGGSNGGDDCDHYCTDGPDKRSEETAFCRVLQQPVNNGDVCTAWMDDDWIDWKRAQALIEELDGKA